MAPCVGSENSVYFVATETPNESLNSLICYWIDCTYKVCGSITLVQILDTAFNYSQIQYISILGYFRVRLWLAC